METDCQYRLSDHRPTSTDGAKTDGRELVGPPQKSGTAALCAIFCCSGRGREVDRALEGRPERPRLSERGIVPACELGSQSWAIAEWSKYGA